MAADEKWYFTKEQLQNTPSRRCGLDADKELSYRQQAANFIQDMGQKLQVSQLCINTAIVYMHRFYMFHSFTHFPWNTIAAAAFFLAAKVEEQPRKLEHVIRIANHCLHREQPVVFDAKSEQYAAQSQDLVFNENVLLQTLGFDVAIDHPHTHVVRCCHLVRASIDLSKTSYFMASNSLHLTTMCLQYKPTVVACFCIHLATKWSNWQIPKSNEGKDWYYYVDKTVTAELLEQLTSEFLKIFDKCPSRLKRKITSISHNQSHNIDQLHAASTSSSPFDPDSKKYHSLDTKDSGPSYHRNHHESKQALLATPDGSDPHKKPQRPHESQQRPDLHREYREKKERERLEREKAAATSGQHHKSSSSGTVSGTSSTPSALQVPSSKHMPPTSQSSSKPHHRPPQTGLDPSKMKIHHRPNDGMGHREHPKDMPRDLTNGRDSRETIHRDREHLKREYLAQQQGRSDSKLDSHGLGHSASDLSKVDQNRQKVLDAKLPPKHDPNRHRREIDPKYAQKLPPRDTVNNLNTNNSGTIISANNETKLKPPNSSGNLISAGVQDKNLYNKQINATSQRHKSPFSDIKSSVPPPSLNVHVSKTDMRNGTSVPLLPTTDNLNKPSWPSSQQQQQQQTQQQPHLVIDPLQQQQQQPINQLSDKLTDDSPQSGLLSPPPVPATKKSSLFSPEKTPPQMKKSWNVRTPPSSGKRSTDTPHLPVTTTVPLPVSPFGSPPPIQSHPKLQTPTSLRRNRTSSSGSEPELRPVVKKLDQISGFENIIRDSKMGIKLPKVPDIIQPICDRPALDIKPILNETSISKELKPPDIIKPFNTSGTDSSLNQLQQQQQQPTMVNGIETDPVVISTLLKEVVTPVNSYTEETTKTIEFNQNNVQMPLTPAPTPIEYVDKYPKQDHHHKSEKKKKKDKHKHKDKEKGRDEKKKKHKDKDRHKIKTEKLESDTPNEPSLKITIPKKVIEPIIDSSGSSGLKVKISRDKIKPDSIITESLPPPPSNPSTLKIKIMKDQIQYNSVVDSSVNNNGNTSSSTSSRKRDRDKSATASSAAEQQGVVPPTKIIKSNYSSRDSRQNGRNSYNKVMQMGDGEGTHLRLAESKYHSKGASKTS